MLNELKLVLEDAHRRGFTYLANLYSFPQVYGSTTGAWGGVGGMMMTPMQTWVLEEDNQYLVYFGGKVAMHITDSNGKILQDIANQDVQFKRSRYQKS